MSSVLGRFESKISYEPMSGCWLWIGSTKEWGHGQFNFKGKIVRAHRLSWMLYRKAPIKGKQLNHICNVPCCVNPAHLYIGSQYENMQDKKRRGAHHNTKKTHCKRGHECTPENTYIQKGKHRGCRKCRYDYMKEYRGGK